MTFSASSLTQGVDTANLTNYVTASITPAANKLILATVVGNFSLNATAPVSPTLAGNGLTWVKVNSVDFEVDTTTTFWSHIAIFRAMGAAPTSGVVSITWAATTDTCIWNFTMLDGAITTGSAGDTAIIQSAATRNVGSASTSALTVTLASFSNINNGTFAAFGASGAPAGASFTAVAATGFTILATTGGELCTCGTEWRADNTVSAAISFVKQYKGIGGVALEIGFSAVAAAFVARLRMLTGAGY